MRVLGAIGRKMRISNATRPIKPPNTTISLSWLSWPLTCYNTLVFVEEEGRLFVSFEQCATGYLSTGFERETHFEFATCRLTRLENIFNLSSFQQCTLCTMHMILQLLRAIFLLESERFLIVHIPVSFKLTLCFEPWWRWRLATRLSIRSHFSQETVFSVHVDWFRAFYLRG